MPEWFEDEAFWESTYAFMFPEERFEKTSEEVDGILALTGVETGVALDLCSGPGRHSVELAKRGFSVTGVDRTAFMLAKAREHATDEGVEVEWVESDMREFVRPDAFDLAVSMFTSFGYFDDDAENAGVLGNLFTSLKPGGALLVDTVGKERLASIFLASSVDRHDDGRIMIERRRILDGWEKMWAQWIVLDGEHVAFDMEFTHRIYSGRELRLMLEAAGFVDVRTYGDLQGGEYAPVPKRLIAVGRKP